jgi:hypothetical protein
VVDGAAFHKVLGKDRAVTENSPLRARHDAPLDRSSRITGKFPDHPILYREDIPTPTQRFKGETIVQGWVDVEETVEISGKKIPIVAMPMSTSQMLPASSPMVGEL